MSFIKKFLKTTYIVPIVAMILFLAMPGGEARASSETERPTISSGQLSPQEDGTTDPEANLPALFAVYTITWAGFFAFVLVMSKRQREMRREIDLLKTALNERDQNTG